MVGAIRRDLAHDLTISETVRRARRCRRRAPHRLRARGTTPARLAGTSPVSLAPSVVGAICRDLAHDLTLSETVRRARRCRRCRLRARVTTPAPLAGTSPVSLTPGEECRVQGVGIEVWGLDLRVQGLVFWVGSSGVRVWGLGFRVEGLGLGFRVEG